MSIPLAFILLLGVVAVAVLPAHAGPRGREPVPAPTGLLCNLLPSGVESRVVDAYPRFCWIMNSNDSDEVQTAFQVNLDDTDFAARNGRAWVYDSGRTPGDSSVAVLYRGQALLPNHDYWWRVRTYDRQGRESAWSKPARFRTGTLSALREIGEGIPRLPVVQTPVALSACTTLPNGNRLFDFGRDAFAGLRLSLSGLTVGTPIIVHLGEALGKDGGVDRRPPGSVRYHRAEMAAQAGVHEYVVPLTEKDARRMSPEIGPVMPFRYVEIEGSARIVGPAIQTVAHYPFDDGAARFTSSNPKLNAVWELCRYTMKATSFCGVFVDGDRERLPYEADAYLNQLGWYACTRDFALPRYTGEHLLTHTTWPTEWFLHSVLIAWADYRYSGDDDSLRRCYDELKPKALIELAGPDGLIRVTDPEVPASVLAGVHAHRMEDIVDWPPPERDGYEMRPVNTVVNAFHYRALREMAGIADAVGHPGDAAMYRATAAKVYASLNEKLFDRTTGVYVDGEGSTHSSLHANLFPLAFGLVPPDRVGRVAAFVKSRGMACSVYAAQYLMEALYNSGQDTYALDLMLAPGDRSWDHMAHGIGTTLATEAWDQKYKPNQDWNHAWGAAPANLIPRFIMGVEPTEPGFRTLRVRPQPGGLESASLDLPTVRGTVRVAFDNHPGNPFALTIHLPANTRAEVWLPRRGRDDTRVTLDGKPIEGIANGEFVVAGPVGSGAHTLTR